MGEVMVMRDAAMLTRILQTALAQVVADVTFAGDMYEEADPEDGSVIRDGFWITVDGRDYLVSIAETSDSLGRRGG